MEPLLQLERSWLTMNSSWSRALHRIGMVCLRGLLLVLLTASSPLNFAVESTTTPKDFVGKATAVLMSASEWTAGQWILQLSVVFLVCLVINCGVYALVLAPKWNWRVPSTCLAAASGIEPQQQQEPATTEWFAPLKSTSPENSKQFVLEPVVTDPSVDQRFGSWSVTLGLLPFGWFVVLRLFDFIGVNLLEIGDSKIKTSANSTIHGWRLFEIQQLFVHVAVLSSCLLLLVTLDLVLQERKSVGYPGKLLGFVRRGYTRWTWLRVLFNWMCVAAIGWLVFGSSCVAKAHLALVQWMVRHHVLPNESWRVFLAAIAFSCDLVLLLSDPEFPTFATARGTFVFGFWREFVVIRYGIKTTHRVLLTAKWLFGFLMFAWVLPLDCFVFLQEFSYYPKRFGQHVLTDFEHQVAVNESSQLALTELSTVVVNDNQRVILVPMRFFKWPLMEVFVPAFVILMIALLVFGWLFRRQQAYVSVTSSPPDTVMEEASKIAHYTKRPSPSVHYSVAPKTRMLLYREAKIMRLYTTRAKIDMACCVASIASIVLAIYQLRTLWQIEQVYQINTEIFTEGSAYFGWSAFVWPGETYEVLLWALTLFLWQQIYRRSRLRFAIMYLRNAIPPQVTSFWSIRSLRWRFLCEMVVNSLWLVPFLHGRFTIKEYRFHPPPGTHECPQEMLASTDPSSNVTKCFVQYQYNYEIVNMLTIVRFYWLVRGVRSLNHLVVFQPKSILMMGWFAKLQMQSLSWNFRVLFSMQATWLFTALFGILWLTTAYCVCIFERPLPSHFLETESHGLWLAVVTMASVGYGDSVPMTLFGRTMIFVGSVLGGALFFSLLTSVFLDSLKGTKEENRFVVVVDKTRWQHQVRKLAIWLISVNYQRHQVMTKLASISESPNTTTMTTTLKTLRKRQQRLGAQVFRVAQRFHVLRKNPPVNAEEDLIEQIHWWENNTMRRLLDQMHQQNKLLLDAMEKWLVSQK